LFATGVMWVSPIARRGVAMAGRSGVAASARASVTAAAHIPRSANGEAAAFTPSQRRKLCECDYSSALTLWCHLSYCGVVCCAGYVHENCHPNYDSVLRRCACPVVAVGKPAANYYCCQLPLGHGVEGLSHVYASFSIVGVARNVVCSNEGRGKCEGLPKLPSPKCATCGLGASIARW